MTNEVRVQSGVGLGMKIAFGFVLFFIVVMGGTCVACGACATLGVAAAKKQQFDRLAADAGRAQVEPGPKVGHKIGEH